MKVKLNMQAVKSVTDEKLLEESNCFKLAQMHKSQREAHSGRRRKTERPRVSLCPVWPEGQVGE